MKTFKRIDLLVQLISMVITVIVFIVNALDATWILFQIVAGWQLLSIIIHFINRWHPYKGGRRYNFQLVLISTLILLVLIRFFHLLLILAYPVAFTVLLMPLYYWWVCYTEVFNYSKRPLELI
jgi:hypothetical protein